MRLCHHPSGSYTGSITRARFSESQLGRTLDANSVVAIQNAVLQGAKEPKWVPSGRARTDNRRLSVRRRVTPKYRVWKPRKHRPKRPEMWVQETRDIRSVIDISCQSGKCQLCY